MPPIILILPILLIASSMYKSKHQSQMPHERSSSVSNNPQESSPNRLLQSKHSLYAVASVVCLVLPCINESGIVILSEMIFPPLYWVS